MDPAAASEVHMWRRGRELSPRVCIHRFPPRRSGSRDAESMEETRRGVGLLTFWMH
jgi:hypothetical protein